MWSDRFYFTWAPQPLRLLLRKRKFFFFFLATLSLSLIGTAYATTRGMSFSHEAEREAVQLNVVFLPPFFAVLTMPFFFSFTLLDDVVFFFFTALFVLFCCIKEKKKKSTQLLNIGYSLYHDWAFWRTCIRPSFFFSLLAVTPLVSFPSFFFFFQFLLPEHDSSSALHYNQNTLCFCYYYPIYTRTRPL